MNVKLSVTRFLNIIATAILVSVPFYALLTVWGSSVLGHYTALRLYTEVGLILSVIGALYLIVVDSKIRRIILSSKLVWLISAYIVVIVMSGAIAYSTHNVTAKALGYGLIVDSRFLMFFIVTWALALSSGFIKKHWIPIVLWPATIVTAFGLAQAFVLPRDFLKHFGYGPSTIVPFGTVNSNSAYVRIESTLRGVNPYGAYLVIIISSLGGLVMKLKRSWPSIVLLLGCIVTMLFTFSRSAWLGAFFAVACLAILSLYKARYFLWVVVASAAIITIGGSIIVSDHSPRLQNIFYHTQTGSSITTTSDQGHLSGLKSGLKDIYHQPLGGGVGTAGPASTYNPKRQRIAENYYIQIGQETGIIGLGLFIAISIYAAYLLWLRRSDVLALVLLVSFVGLFVVNNFSHAWADPTLSYLWWGLAGVAMSIKPKISKARS